MTDAEFRQQAFNDAYNALVARYGFAFGAQVQPEILGHVVQVRPALVLAPVADWKAPDAGTATSDEALPAPDLMSANDKVTT